MWKIWLLFDPRRALIGILAFAFFMVMVNHFVQLSTPRYGSWLNGPYPAAASEPAAPAATP
ncbi:MAG: light-harvesting protein [Alphaproteobacteria bacterium]|jgi:light-harvesting complex 1 alpha chain|nr:light-harvesting protein [Alphaproteobacteria bacterium]